MNYQSKDFFLDCERSLGFLVDDFAFKRVDQKQSMGTYEIRYSNGTVGVSVHFEIRDFWITTRLWRLEGGSFVRNAGEIRPQTDLHSFDLDDIAAIRSGGRDESEKLVASWLPRSVQDMLTRTARNLQEHASDVLHGDFSIFAQADKIVKERARGAAFQKWGSRARDFGWDSGG